MRSRHHALPLLLALQVIAAAPTGCSIYLMKVDPNSELGSLTIPEKNANPARWIRQAWAAESSTVQGYVLGTLAGARTERDAIEGAPSEAGATLLTFVHLSDVQLRDERSRLWTRSGSRVGDRFVGTFERDDRQSKYDHALYLSTVKAVNELFEERLDRYLRDPGAERLAALPMMVVHTGDSVDAGTRNELREFIAISDQLALPWLQTVGNHDANLYGNFDGHDVFLGNPMQGSLVVNGPDEFVLQHRAAPLVCPPPHTVPACREIAELKRRNDGLLPIAAGDEGQDFREPTQAFLNDLLGTEDPNRAHGLTIEQRSGATDRSDLPFYRGYYAISLRSPEPVSSDELRWRGAPLGFRAVVLNTYETGGGPTFQWHQGTMTPEQLEWLDGEVRAASLSGERVLVFGHHQLTDGFADDATAARLREILLHPAVLAYFCGHTHAYGIHSHHRTKGGPPLWEVVTAGLIEYPQQGSLVTIRALLNGDVAIDLQSLTFPGVLGAPCSFLAPSRGAHDLTEARSPTLLEAAWCAQAGAVADAPRKDWWTWLESLVSDPLHVDELDRNVRLVVAAPGSSGGRP